jgi:hypothetical protein
MRLNSSSTVRNNTLQAGERPEGKPHAAQALAHTNVLPIILRS